MVKPPQPPPTTTARSPLFGGSSALFSTISVGGRMGIPSRIRPVFGSTSASGVLPLVPASTIPAVAPAVPNKKFLRDKFFPTFFNFPFNSTRKPFAPEHGINRGSAMLSEEILREKPGSINLQFFRTYRLMNDCARRFKRLKYHSFEVLTLPCPHDEVGLRTVNRLIFTEVRD